MSLFVHYLSLPYLIEGIWFTVMVTALGLAGGLILGLVLAAMQLSRFAVLAVLARGYTVIFRGTPLILQMVFAYDALPQIGLKLSAIGAAGLALAANEAPFIAEMLRAGVLGVDRGQVLAGQALGMTPALLMRRIIAPQAIRTMIPAFGNETVSALKNSSLASVISVQELTLRSTQLASSTFDFFSIFFASGLIYLVLTTLVSVIQLFVERALDLDRVTPQGRLAVFLPWRRVDLAIKLAEPAALLAPPHSLLPEMTAPRHTSRSDRAKHAAMVQRNNVAVEVAGLRKSYGEQTVLNGVDLTVRVGEVVALLGPSGSGKSTLLGIVGGLDRDYQGKVAIFGEDLRALSDRALSRLRGDRIGFVFQAFHLLSHLTVLDNVLAPALFTAADPSLRARALSLLDRLGLGERALDTPARLSGGQRQRVAIARALLRRPALLLCDEPTGNLDAETGARTVELFRDLHREEELTIVAVTHEERLAKVATRAVHLHDGKIA
jgi:polar amino acid transport system permease protein